MIQAFGLTIPGLVMQTHGAGLAARAGVVAAPIHQVSPGRGSNPLIVVFAVAVGGLGSIAGSVLTGFGLGLVERLTKNFQPRPRPS